MSNKKNGSRKAIPAVDHFKILERALDKGEWSCPEAMDALLTSSAGAREVDELYGKVSEKLGQNEAVELPDLALNLMIAGQRNGFCAGYEVGLLHGLRFACGASGPGVAEVVATIGARGGKR